MTAFFRRPALSIWLDGDLLPFHRGFLRAPAVFRRQALREYIHEVLHFWQLLGSGFLANLAAAEWGEVLAFESSGSLAPVADDLHTEFTRVDPALGFSAWNLHEALCRYWDVQIIGPHNLLDDAWSQQPFDPEDEHELREAVHASDAKSYSGAQYNEVMERAMLAGDTYAGPYRHVLAQLPPRDAAGFFPLVGYFALQSARPTQVFAAAIDALRGYTWRWPVRRIEHIWQGTYPDVRRACVIACHEATGRPLTPGWDVVTKGPLATHPVYRWYSNRFRGPTFRTWRHTDADLRLATPGDSEHRAHLTSFLRPPVTLFHDGAWTAALPETEAKLRDEYERLAAAATEVDRRCRALELARRLAGSSVNRKSASRPDEVRAVWNTIEDAPGDDLDTLWEVSGDAGDWVTAARIWRVRYGDVTSEQVSLIYGLVAEDPDGDSKACQEAAAGTEPAVAAWAATRYAGAVAERDPTEAQAMYERAIAMSHKHHSADAALGLGYLLRDSDSAAACEAYRRAIAFRDPELSPWAAFNLGLLLARLDRKDEAAAAFESALEFEHWDVDPKAALNLGILYLEGGMLEPARRALDRAWAARHPETWNSVVVALARLDDATETARAAPPL